MAESHSFQAEVAQVLHLVIHSLYGHKEIFLRELVSNASDALDKLRFRALTEPALTADGTPLRIRVVPDREARTLTIEDTGVGMTHDELVRDLGTVARSGSKAFLEQLRASGGGKDVSLIGRFGVGFYSAFLVADRVDVISRAAGEEQAWRWRSDGQERFFVDADARATHGTSVVLHLKPEHDELLEPRRLVEIVRRYSDYVGHPIEVGDQVVNQASALWQRPRSEITDAQYQELYRHLTHVGEDALAWTHFRVEGLQEFVGLLYLPREAPYDLDHGGRRRGVRLFVQRVFIMDDCEEIVPPWLRFLRGVVDSNDLPLNVSRETLQDSAAVRAIRKQVIKKSLDLIESIARDRADDYEKLWAAFGHVLKEGIATDLEHKDRLAGLARYLTTRDEGRPTSLADYVARMTPEQPAIYYVLGESARGAAASPHLEALARHGYEVLVMTDPVDEWVTETLGSFGGKPLVSAMRADLKLGDEAAHHDEREAQGKALAPLLDRMRKALEGKVSDVTISARLVESPCCLVRGAHAPHAFVERLLRERGQKTPEARRVLELNGGHPLVRRLESLVETEPGAPRVDALIDVLYGQALLTEGSPLDDPQRFAQSLTRLLTDDS